MRDQLFKMLMNAEGTSPGGGGLPAGQGAPASAPAQGSQPGAAVSGDQLQALIDTKVGAKLTEFENSFFAKARRAGMLGGKDKSDAVDPPGGDKAPASTSGITPEEFQRLRKRDRAFERSATEHKLTDGQRARMEAALERENPDDVNAWTTSYLTDMGIAKAPPAPQPNNGGTGMSGASRGPSISDGGAPGRDGSLAHEGRVWKMTKADVDALVKEKGIQGAAHELRARLKQDLRGVRLTFPRPGS